MPTNSSRNSYDYCAFQYTIVFRSRIGDNLTSWTCVHRIYSAHFLWPTIFMVLRHKLGTEEERHENFHRCVIDPFCSLLWLAGVSCRHRLHERQDLHCQRFPAVGRGRGHKDGKFIEVGSSDELKSLFGDETEVVDLKGDFVMPGVHDSHLHPPLVYTFPEAGALLFPESLSKEEVLAPWFFHRSIHRIHVQVSPIAPQKNARGNWNSRQLQRFLAKSLQPAIARNRKSSVRIDRHFSFPAPTESC